MKTSAAMSAGSSRAPDEAPAVPDRDERALLRALAAGDREAASQLVEATYRSVYALLCRLCGHDLELAADLTQETYRKAWAELPSFDGRSRFGTWLFRIAYNAFLNHARRPRRIVPLDEATPPVAEGASAQQEVEQRQTAECVRHAVLALPEVLRLMVATRYWGELPVREIARLEGISEPAVRKRLKKALRELAHALKEVA
jgi:RNA polymerase sigma-70 factor (ECF subfamily)